MHIDLLNMDKMVVILIHYKLLYSCKCVQSSSSSSSSSIVMLLIITIKCRAAGTDINLSIKVKHMLQQYKKGTAMHAALIACRCMLTASNV